MGESAFRMKLLIDTSNKRVLFAEADKDCVDFLFHIISLPLATVIDILKKQEMVGSIENLYKSIENLKEAYIQPNQTKHNILNPLVVSASSIPLLQIKNGANGLTKFYGCNVCYNFSCDPNTLCPQRVCRTRMTQDMQFVPKSSMQGEGGFVKGVVTYMVMDDLVVTPMSSTTISPITLLNKLNVKDVGALEEKVVTLGMAEAVKLLKQSLMSKTVLTDVFLSGRESGEKYGDQSGRRIRESRRYTVTRNNGTAKIISPSAKENQNMEVFTSPPEEVKPKDIDEFQPAGVTPQTKQGVKKGKKISKRKR